MSVSTWNLYIDKHSSSILDSRSVCSLLFSNDFDCRQSYRSNSLDIDMAKLISDGNCDFMLRNLCQTEKCYSLKI